MSLSCILIIDDSESDQFISKSLIEKYDSDITVLQAYDGQEALELLAATDQKPDVILLDINMPRMNGHEFLEVYDKDQNGQSAVVVMLTSSKQTKDREQAMLFECVKHYLIKPIDTDDLDDIKALV